MEERRWAEEKKREWLQNETRLDSGLINRRIAGNVALSSLFQMFPDFALASAATVVFSARSS
jgi:hypothetical protein